MIFTPPPAPPGPAVHASPTAVTYTGWEGYSVKGGAYIQTQFKAPATQYPDGAVGLFAGLGGSPTNPAASIQRAGVFMYRNAGAVVEYIPWYQVSPGPPSVFPGTPRTVNPGDNIVLIVSRGSGNYTVVVRNTTQGWTEHLVVNSTVTDHAGEIAAQAFGSPGPNGFTPVTFNTPGSLGSVYSWPFASAAHVVKHNAHAFTLYGP